MIYFLFFCPERMFLGLEQLKGTRGRSLGQDASSPACHVVYSL